MTIDARLRATLIITSLMDCSGESEGKDINQVDIITLVAET